jgi:hypothetical protein
VIRLRSGKFTLFHRRSLYSEAFFWKNGKNGTGRDGSYLPPLPQIRTCPIKASGSSGHGLACRELSVVVALTRHPVSMHRPCFPPTVPQPGASFSPPGPCGVVPRLQRYYEALRFPAPVSPRFVVLRLAIPRCASVVCSPPIQNAQSVGQGLRVPVPSPDWHRGECRASQVPGEPWCASAVFVDPGGTGSTRPIAVFRRGPRCVQSEGSPLVVLSGLSGTALALAVYASQGGLLHATQDSLPAAGQALPGGIEYPQSSYERFPRCSRYISSSFPKLSWRKDASRKPFGNKGL